MDAQNSWTNELETCLSEIAEQVKFEQEGIFVIGCSTSEVAGKKIGTAGASAIGEDLYEPLQKFAAKHNIFLAFQGCEHINRSITIERHVAKKYNLEPVSVVPVISAGGSMSTYAYSQMEDPVVVEGVQAHAGIDIGQTLIGMHLKPVAVPIRTSIKQIGEAVITIATTRPKLIGGIRAQYE